MSNKNLKLVGYEISPFVRKVIVTLKHKGLDYDLDPLNPYLEKQRIVDIYDNGTVPVLLHGDSTIPESSEICRYLDSIAPSELIYPQDKGLLERAQQFEHFADTKMIQVFGGFLFFQRIIKVFFLKKQSSDHYVKEAIDHLGPEILAHLEKEVPENGYLCQSFSMADLSISGWLRIGMLAGLSIEPESYPKLSRYLERVFSVPAYREAINEENQLDVIKFAKETYVKGTVLIE